MNSRKQIVTALLLAGLFLLSACKSTQKVPSSGDLAVRAFPTLTIPAMFTEQDEVVDYVLKHFWDPYMSGAAEFVTDSLHMGGVDRKEMVNQISSYVAILENSPLDKARESIVGLMDMLEAGHDASPALYDAMTEMFSSCLYDPNSELRDEDIYYPFVKRLAESPYTKESMVAAFAHDAQMCSLNAKGTRAADFAFTDSDGRKGTLYGIDSEYTVVVFVNPGCHACGEVVEPLSSELVMSLISSGRLTVLGMYIDEEVNTWLSNRDELPPHWLNAYDPEGVIRTDVTYNVRAIPSIYMLDSNKTVIMKDAASQRAIAFLQSI